MALIRCRTCGGMVSSEAVPPCPHCKDPYITEERKQRDDERMSEAEKENKELDRQSAIMHKRWEDGRCGYCNGPLGVSGSRSGAKICIHRCGENVFRETGWLEDTLRRRKKEEEEAKAQQESCDIAPSFSATYISVREWKRKNRYWIIFSYVVGGIAGGLLFAFLAKFIATNDFFEKFGLIVGVLAGISLFLWSINKEDGLLVSCAWGCGVGCLGGCLGGIIIAATLVTLLPQFIAFITIGIVAGAVTGYVIYTKWG